MENQAALRRIYKVAEDLTSLLHHNTAPEGRPASLARPPSIPSLDLPFPHDLLLPLRTIGLPDHTLEKASSRVLQWIHESQELHLKSYTQACNRVMVASNCHDQTPVLLRLRDTFRVLYEKRDLISIREEIKSIELTHRRRNANSRRTPFNNVNAF